MSSWVQAIKFLAWSGKNLQVLIILKYWEHIMRDTQHSQVTWVWISFIFSNGFYLKKKKKIISNSHLTRNKIISSYKEAVKIFLRKLSLIDSTFQSNWGWGKTAKFSNSTYKSPLHNVNFWWVLTLITCVAECFILCSFILGKFPSQQEHGGCFRCFSFKEEL